MEASEPGDVAILALAVICLLPALAAGWKAASWRGDIFSKWSARVDVAHAGLNERVKEELVALQEAITDSLGTLSGFTPAEVWADPDPLVAHANRCADVLRARDKLRGRFRRLRQLSTVLIPTLAAYILGWLSATLYFTDVVTGGWVKVLGLALGAAAAGIAILIFCAYAYLEAKLTAAEELAAGDHA